jgi:hypothetical protein
MSTICVTPVRDGPGMHVCMRVCLWFFSPQLYLLHIFPLYVVLVIFALLEVIDRKRSTSWALWALLENHPSFVRPYGFPTALFLLKTYLYFLFLLSQFQYFDFPGTCLFHESYLIWWHVLFIIFSYNPLFL